MYSLKNVTSWEVVVFQTPADKEGFKEHLFILEKEILFSCKLSTDCSSGRREFIFSRKLCRKHINALILIDVRNASGKL